VIVLPPTKLAIAEHLNETETLNERIAELINEVRASRLTN